MKKTLKKAITLILSLAMTLTMLCAGGTVQFAAAAGTTVTFYVSDEPESGHYLSLPAAFEAVAADETPDAVYEILLKKNTEGDISTNRWSWPAKPIIIQSADTGNLNTLTLRGDVRINVNGDLLIDNIILQSLYGATPYPCTADLYLNGHSFVLGSGVKGTRGENTPADTVGECFRAIFGGGDNTTPIDHDTSVTILGGYVEYVYGGGAHSIGAQGGTPRSTKVIISGANACAGIVAGGGNTVNTMVWGNTSVEIKNGAKVIYRVLGGFLYNGATMGDTKIIIEDSTVGSVMGGDDQNPTEGDSTIVIKNSKVFGDVMGNCSGSTGGTSVLIEHSEIKKTSDLYGVFGGNVYGCGNNFNYVGTLGSSSVELTGGTTVESNVYGGGRLVNNDDSKSAYNLLHGSAEVIVDSSTVNGKIYAGNQTGIVLGGGTVSLTNGARVTGGVVCGGEGNNKLAPVMGTVRVLCDGSVTLGTPGIIQGSAAYVEGYYVGGAAPAARKSLFKAGFTGDVNLFMLDEVSLTIINEISDPPSYDVVAAFPRLSGVDGISSTADGAADLPARSFTFAGSPNSPTLTVTGPEFTFPSGGAARTISMADFTTASLDLSGGLLTGSVSITRGGTPLSGGETLSVGDVLTANTGGLSGGSLFFYQWYRGNDPISGTNGASYTVSPLDGSLTANLSVAVSAKGFIGAVRSAAFAVEHTEVPLVVGTTVVNTTVGDTSGWSAGTLSGWRYDMKADNFNFLTLVGYTAQKDITAIGDLIIAAGGLNHIGTLDVNGEVLLTGRGVFLIDSLGPNTVISAIGPAVFVKNGDRYVMPCNIGEVDGEVTFKDGLTYVLSDGACLTVKSSFYRHRLTVPQNSKLILESGSKLVLNAFDSSPEPNDGYSGNITRIEVNGALTIEDGAMVDAAAGKLVLSQNASLNCVGTGYVKGTLEAGNGAALQRLFLVGTATISGAGVPCGIDELVVSADAPPTLKFAVSSSPQKCVIGAITQTGDNGTADIRLIGSYYFPKQDGSIPMGEPARALDLPDEFRIESGVAAGNCALSFQSVNAVIEGEVDLRRLEVTDGALFVDTAASPALNTQTLTMRDAYLFAGSGTGKAVSVGDAGLSMNGSVLYAIGGLQTSAYTAPQHSAVYESLSDIPAPRELYGWQADYAGRTLLANSPVTYTGAADYTALSGAYATTTYTGPDKYTLSDASLYDSVPREIDMKYFFQQFSVAGLDANGKFIRAIINEETRALNPGAGITTILRVDASHRFLIPASDYKPPDTIVPGSDTSTSNTTTSSGVLGGQSSSSLCSVGVHKYGGVTSSTSVSCTSAAAITRSCTSCAASITQTTAPALGHVFSTTTTAASCTAAGSIVSTCSRCHEASTKTLPALGHSYVNGVCTRCGANSSTPGTPGTQDAPSTPMASLPTVPAAPIVTLSADPNGLVTPDAAALNTIRAALAAADKPEELTIVIEGLIQPGFELRLNPDLTALLRQNEVSLLVESEYGSLLIPSAALPAGGSVITIVFDCHAELTEAQQTEIGERPYVRITVLFNGVVQPMEAANLRLSLPYTLQQNENGEGLLLRYAAEDGTVQDIGGSYVNGMLLVTLSHLSVFYVAYDESLVWNNPFADVLPGQWYYEAVRFVYRQGLFNGVSDSRFGSYLPMTRAMLVTVLWRLEQKPDAGTEAAFTDITQEWYRPAVAWAAEKGLVDGYGEGRFGPENPITREQLAVILHRYAGSPQQDAGQLKFSDAADVSDWAREAMLWAAADGIITGKPGDLLDPKGSATRTEVAAVLQRYLKK